MLIISADGTIVGRLCLVPNKIVASDSPMLLIINTHLHAAWAHLRKVQNEAVARRSAWLHAQADVAAKESNTKIAAALRQLPTESTMKTTYRKLRPIAKGQRSGPISQIKVPCHEWMYHRPSDTLYHYVKGDFLSHSREPTLKGRTWTFPSASHAATVAKRRYHTSNNNSDTRCNNIRWNERPRRVMARGVGLGGIFPTLAGT